MWLSQDEIVRGRSNFWSREKKFTSPYCHKYRTVPNLPPFPLSQLYTIHKGAHIPWNPLPQLDPLVNGSFHFLAELVRSPIHI